MLKQRIITAAVLIPIALWGFFYLDGNDFTLFISVVVLAGAWEWARLIGFVKQTERFGYAIVCAVVLFVLWLLPNWSRLVILIGICWWGYAWFLVKDFPNSAARWKHDLCFSYVIGFFILVPAWQGLILLKQLPNGNWIILSLMLLVWSADIGAYFAGRKWGSVKLAAKVSPGKTWEGVLGGLAAVLVVALLIRIITGFAAGQLILGLLCAVALTVFSVLGDLTESMFKREAGLKDSSNLLPGHGGVLDRIDSLTAAIPMSILLLWVLGAI